MEEAHEAQARLRTEMDGLRKQLCEEQLANTELNLVENNLKVARESIARLNAEKSDLCEEAANVLRVWRRHRPIRLKCCKRSWRDLKVRLLMPGWRMKR